MDFTRCGSSGYHVPKGPKDRTGLKRAFKVPSTLMEVLCCGLLLMLMGPERFELPNNGLVGTCNVVCMAS